MSRLYVGITDSNWYSLIKEEFSIGKSHMYVNFWTPSSRRIFKAIEPGEIFLFKAHKKKHNLGESGEIVGGAVFVEYRSMSIDDAWDIFGTGNGRSSLAEMKNDLLQIKNRNNIQSDMKIGCIILEKVFFFSKPIQAPNDWSNSIVRGKTYSTDDEIGNELFKEASTRLKQIETDLVSTIDGFVDELNVEGVDREAIVKARVNQGVFRERLLNRYHKCCLCGIRNNNLLIASHIKPWRVCSGKEKLDIENGFIFCPNHDALFDKGFITFNGDGAIEISSNLSVDDCEALGIASPTTIELSCQNEMYLQYHRQYIFKP